MVECAGKNQGKFWIEWNIHVATMTTKRHLDSGGCGKSAGPNNTLSKIMNSVRL